MMRVPAAISVGLLGLLIAAPLQAGQVAPESVTVTPIVLDGEEIFPGGAVSQIVGLKKGGDGFVSVRAAPSVKADEIGRLTQGAYVIATDRIKRGTEAGFVGVIYNLDDKSEKPLTETCGLRETPPYDKGPYKGPCKSGWVAQRFVQVLAD
ncbi:hypothetical protein [Rhizobium sp. C4]|uniref:hypothetical protein n=1 Tax=Rhizobium sp. C4 TaxID=1349800 RepID=UPI001E4A61C4|nr:hypothetical protein [Rhizobium sp. C4]MCD2175301.1 hypothetical protein [Rhizobium sp. C4]